MGKLLQTSLAVILTTLIVGLFVSATISISMDNSKGNYTFSTYGNYENKTTTLAQNGSTVYTNTNDPITNFQLISQTIENIIAEQQRNFSSDMGVAEKLLNAFGLTASLVLNILYLFLAVIAEGVNFAYGMTTNLSQLPPPWNAVGVIGTIGVILAVVYLVFKVISAYVKWDL